MPSLPQVLLPALACCLLFSIQAKSQDTEIEILISQRPNSSVNYLDTELDFSFKSNQHFVKTGHTYQNENYKHGSNYRPMVAMRPRKSYLEINSSQYFQHQELSFGSQALGLGVQIIGELLQGTRGF